MIQSARFTWLFWLGLGLLLTPACHRSRPPAAAPFAGTAVQLRETPAGYRLYHRGQPFFVQGACILDPAVIPALAAAGGNTIRTYPGIDLDSVFQLAEAHGLMVIPGLDVTPMRHGLDYRDTAQVAGMKARVQAQILRYRDEPSLLMWGLGNEVHLLHPEAEAAIFAVIDDLSHLAHTLDPAHPTTYMADGPMGALKVWRACPDLDVISVNTFRSLEDLTRVLRWGGGAIDRPVLVSEWAPSGYWNASVTSWGAPIEQNEAEKAFSYRHLYEAHLTEAAGGLLGSCVFLWGQKQEQTHTWFSFFSEQGEPGGLVDLFTYLWRGHYPPNQAPIAEAIALADGEPGEPVLLHAGAICRARGYGVDAEGDSLRISWEITPEYQRRLRTGGDAEARPVGRPDLLLQQRGDSLLFRVPAQPGAYRLFLYVRDPQGKTGAMNIPFFVTLPPTLEETTLN